MTRRAPRLFALAAALSLAGCSIVGPTSEVQIFAPRTAITGSPPKSATTWSPAPCSWHTCAISCQPRSKIARRSSAGIDASV